MQKIRRLGFLDSLTAVTFDDLGSLAALEKAHIFVVTMHIDSHFIFKSIHHMKSLKQFSILLNQTEKLKINQFLAIKGGDDKRPQRPVDPTNPAPNGQYEDPNSCLI